MVVGIPKDTLTRLERMIREASDDDDKPLVVGLVIVHEDGSEPSADEALEIEALLAGYGADGPLDEIEEAGEAEIG